MNARLATDADERRTQTMDWIEGAIDALKRANGELVASLPDTNLALLIEAVDADDALRTMLVSREEDAVGVLAGAWLGVGLVRTDVGRESPGRFPDPCDESAEFDEIGSRLRWSLFFDRGRR